jgi:2'-phosphotransferase
MDQQGYVPISEILDWQIFRKNNCKSQDILGLVANSDKQRYELSRNKSKIRASQGHTIDTLDEESLYETITNPAEIPLVIHGTDKKAWGYIKSQGLNRMARTHIHFAIGYPGDKEVISGMRGSCDVIVELDVPKAMAAGIVFQKSKNGVILSKGINGVIPPNFFRQVTLREKNKTTVEIIQDYEFALVLDFEATCEDKKKLNCQEIIEFPVVPVNLRTQEVLSDKIFHHYVRPEVNPKLSKF